MRLCCIGPFDIHRKESELRQILGEAAMGLFVCSRPTIFQKDIWRIQRVQRSPSGTVRDLSETNVVRGHRPPACYLGIGDLPGRRSLSAADQGEGLSYQDGGYWGVLGICDASLNQTKVDIASEAGVPFSTISETGGADNTPASWHHLKKAGGA